MLGELAVALAVAAVAWRACGVLEALLVRRRATEASGDELAVLSRRVESLETAEQLRGLRR